MPESSSAGAAPAALARVRPLLPWLSLGVGIASALVMDRGPKRAAVVAGAAVLLWATLIALRLMARVELADDARPWRRRLLALLHRSSLMATQSLVQLALFFALPFYVQAAVLDAGHVAFVVVLGALCVVALWDPLSARMLRSTLAAPLLPVMASFVALTAVLPGLGLSIEQSLWLASAIAGAGTVLTAALGVAAAQRRAVLVAAVVAALVVPLALHLGAARVVPAAPLRLVEAAIGTRREGKWVGGVATRFESAPERLVCATAIFSPVGVRDRLFHLWHKDGVQRARIALEFRGGRGQGFRTQSRIQLGPHERGTYRCTVVTAAGQLLGSTEVHVGTGR